MIVLHFKDSSLGFCQCPFAKRTHRSLSVSCITTQIRIKCGRVSHRANAGPTHSLSNVITPEYDRSLPTHASYQTREQFLSQICSYSILTRMDIGLTSSRSHSLAS